jgi:hypothetical protein
MPDGSVPLALIVLRESLVAQILGLQQALKLFDQAHPEVLAEVMGEEAAKQQMAANNRATALGRTARAVVVNPFAPPRTRQVRRIPLLEDDYPPVPPANGTATIIPENIPAESDSQAEPVNGHAIVPGPHARTCKDGSHDRRYRAEIDSVRRGDKDGELTRLWGLMWCCQRIADELESNITNVSRRALFLNLPKRNKAAVMEASIAATGPSSLQQPPVPRGRPLKPANIDLNIKAAKRFPEDAPALLSRFQLESQVEASVDLRFPQPMERRCPVCNETFKTSIVDETICAGCLKPTHRRVVEPSTKNTGN